MFRSRIVRGGFRLLFPAIHLDRLNILCFHRVLRETDTLKLTEPTAEAFDRLIGELRGVFNVIPLSEAVERLRLGSLPPLALSITFDDGYGDCARIAGPILKSHGLPATVFIATGFIDNPRMMWNDVIIETIRTLHDEELNLDFLGLGRHPIATIDDKRTAISVVLPLLKHLPSQMRAEAIALFQRQVPPQGVLPVDLMMTSEEIRGLGQYGIEVGAHTVSHPILKMLDKGDAYCEIRDSKLLLEGLVGEEVRLFAYPNGRPTADYDRGVRDMLPEIGFIGAVNTAAGVSSSASDPFQLPRFTPWRKSSSRFVPSLLWMRRNLYKPEF